MGLGKLNPGCNCSCENPECSGGLELNDSTCVLTWWTNGEFPRPIQVEVRHNNIAFSSHPFGTQQVAISPGPGVYSLWIRCNVGDSLVKIAEVILYAGACDCCSQFATNDIERKLSISIGGVQWERGSLVTTEPIVNCVATAGKFVEPVEDVIADSYHAGGVVIEGVMRQIYYRFSSSWIRYIPHSGVAGRVFLVGFAIPSRVSGGFLTGLASQAADHTPGIACGFSDIKVSTGTQYGWGIQLTEPDENTPALPPFPPPPECTGCLFIGQRLD
jgi:hypothetical protein